MQKEAYNGLTSLGREKPYKKNGGKQQQQQQQQQQQKRIGALTKSYGERKS